MKTPELKPCPECGKTPGFTCLFKRKGNEKQLVIAEITHACKGMQFHIYEGSYEKAADAWNRRVTDEEA